MKVHHLLEGMVTNPTQAILKTAERMMRTTPSGKITNHRIAGAARALEVVFGIEYEHAKAELAREINRTVQSPGAVDASKNDPTKTQTGRFNLDR